MLDAAIASPVARDAFMWNGSAWVNRPLESADISDASSTFAANVLVKYDASGNINPNRIDVASGMYTLNEGIAITEDLIYGLNADLSMRHLIASGNVTLTAGDNRLVKINRTNSAAYARTMWQTNTEDMWSMGMRSGSGSMVLTDEQGFGATWTFGTDKSLSCPGAIAAPTITASTTLRGPFKGSSASTATLGDGYNGGMDVTFANGGIFRMTTIDETIFFQLYPDNVSGYGQLETWGAAGLILGTGANSNPVIFQVNRTEVARLNATELLLGNGVDLVGDGFYNIKGDSSGTGRIDIRSDTVNCYASFNPQNQMFMGWQSATESYAFGLTGKTGGNYRSIYYKYSDTDLVFLAQWADGSWDHEMGRWNDHGTLTLTRGLEVDPSNGGYGIQFGSNAYDQILRNGDGLEVRAQDHTRFIVGASTEVARVISGSVLIGQTSSDPTAAALQVAGRIHAADLGLGSTYGATSMGSIAQAIPVYDHSGTLRGYVPIYDSYS